MNNSINKKKLFLHLGPSIIESSIREVSTTNSLLVPSSLPHDDIWRPKNLKKLDNLEEEIVASDCEKAIISSGDNVLPSFFASVEKVNNKSMWQGDRLRKMFFRLARTHDITLIYYMKPVFEHVRESYALNFVESKYTKRGQQSFEDFCTKNKKHLLHCENVDSWANISGIKNIVVRPYVQDLFPSSDYFKDVSSIVGMKAPGAYVEKVSRSEIDKRTEGIIISESVIKTLEDVYDDNKALCDKFLNKKESRKYLESFAPHYGELAAGLGSSLRRFFGF